MSLTVRKKWNWQLAQFRDARTVALYLWGRSIPRYIVEADGKRIRIEPPYEPSNIERQIREQEKA